MDFFSHQQNDMSAATLEEFEAQVDQLFEMKEKAKALEFEASQINVQVDELQEKLIAVLEAHGKTKHVGRKGSISLSIDSYPSLPKEPLKREAFFAYLKQRNIYDDMVTVNAQTLRRFYKDEKEANGGEENPDFAIPGLEPYERKKLSMRRGK
jgi:hypothetical protein